MRLRKVTFATEQIDSGLNYIENVLKSYGMNKSNIMEAMLLSEELMIKLMERAPEHAIMQISIRRKIGMAYIQVTVPGQPLNKYQKSKLEVEFDSTEMRCDTEIAIRNILIRSYADKIKYKNKNGYNTVRITAGIPEKQLALMTMVALFASIAAGVCMKTFLPTEIITSVDQFLLSPVEEIFINMLTLISGPAIFFSIVCCVSQLAEFSDPGRVSIKVLVGYTFTTIAAVLTGISVFNAIKPGTPGLLSELVSSSAQVKEAGGDMSVLQTIVTIVPSNVIDPFLNVNSRQLVFLALLCGIAVGMIRDYSVIIKNFFEAGNILFSKIMSLIVNTVPFAAFFCTVSIVIRVGKDALLSIGEMLLTVAAGIGCMLILYGLLIWLVGRVNPWIFLKKYAPTMKMTFILGSGIAAIPKTMRACKSKLGISPKVSSFSIPFGATINMDGNCVYLTIAGLFLARLCGIELFNSDILTMIFTVVVLSVGAPIAPGTAMLSLFVLLTQMGVSSTVICLILGINFLIEMLLAMSNTAGDVVISFIVARSENLVDLDCYYSK